MTRIVADTTSGLSSDMAQRLGIPLVPQIIHFGEESFREGIDIDQITFLKRLKTDRELPRTAAPFPGDFIAAFVDTARADESIVCIFPSAEVSGTVRSAMTAREEFPGADIRIIDSRTIAGPLATMVLEADRAAKAGATADEVEALARALIPRARVFFLVDTLEYLQRGGRIGGAQALVGSILQVKPILAFRDGHIEPYEKARTKSRAFSRLKELVLAEADRGSEARLTVMHSDAPGEASALASDLQAALRAPSVMIMDLVPAIVTHAGPGTLAVGFFAPPSP